MKIIHRITMLILCSAIIYWISTEQSSHLVIPKQSLPQEYMANVFVTHFTEQGELKNQLSAQYWAFLPETKLSKLTAPHLTIYKPDHSVWLVDAKHGQAHQPNIGTIEEIELFDSVVLQRPKTKEFLPVKLETQRCRYQPKTQYAETDAAVTLTKPGLQITGVGLRAYLEKNWVELLHNVKTVYVPNVFNAK